MESQTEEKSQIADQRLKDLNNLITGYIFNKFKELHNENYIEEGVKDVKLCTKAYEASLNDPKEKRLPLEAYFHLLELKKIVEKKHNWQYFKPVFNIPLPDQKGLAKNLEWMEKN